MARFSRWVLVLGAFIAAGIASAEDAPVVVKVRLTELHPTQAVIAHEQVNYKLELYKKDRAALFEDLCSNAGWGKKVHFSAESHPAKPESYRCDNAGKKKRKLSQLKTAVKGPDDKLYLTDGHHTFSAFYDLPEAGPQLEVYVYLQQADKAADLSVFWQQMQQQGNAWLYDALGNTITPQQLPGQLGRASLHNDPYRGAMYFLRGGVWDKPKPAIPFVEFYWAQYLRQQQALQFPGYYSAADYLQWLERISNHLATLQPSSAVFAGFSAAQLGWRGGEHFKQLNALLCQRGAEDITEGALAVALKYRGLPVSCDSRQYLDHTKLHTGLRQLPGAVNSDGSINVLIEIPAGNSAKWQQDKAAPEQLEWEWQNGALRQIQYLPYPANYGIVSGTLLSKANGGDGDPLDVLVLGDALPRGSVQQVKLLGVMRMTDNAEQDDKLIAVPLQGVFADIDDITQLQQRFNGITEQLQLWFEHYKGPGGKVTVQQFDNVDQAMQLLKASTL